MVEELVALARERIIRPDAFFWRTQAGAEIDLVISGGLRLVAIEIKLGPVDQYAIWGSRIWD